MANQVDGQSVGRIEDVTASDSTRFEPTIGLACLVSGNANILCAEDTAPHVVYLNAGQWYPCRAIAVYSTSTTATGITRLYQK
jgi:hypothetical protein